MRLWNGLNECVVTHFMLFKFEMLISVIFFYSLGVVSPFYEGDSIEIFRGLLKNIKKQQNIYTV